MGLVVADGVSVTATRLPAGILLRLSPSSVIAMVLYSLGEVTDKEKDSGLASFIPNAIKLFRGDVPWKAK